MHQTGALAWVPTSVRGFCLLHLPSHRVRPLLIAVATAQTSLPLCYEAASPLGKADHRLQNHTVDRTLAQ